MPVEPFKASAEQKAEISALIEKYKPILYLQNWEFMLCYQDSNFEDGARVNIDTTVQHEYLRCTWNIYPVYFEQDAVKREEIIVHEMMHSLTDMPVRLLRAVHNGDFVSRLQVRLCDEQLTSHLSVIVTSLVNMGLDKESKSGTVEVRGAESPSPTEEGQRGSDCTPPSNPLIQ